MAEKENEGSGDAVVYSSSGRVATITMNRPERLNVINPPWIEAWTTSLDRLDAGEACVALVRAEGRAFCAGGDLKGPIWDLPMHERRRDVERAYDITRRIRRSNVVFVAAVNGPCVGAGTSLALACDLRIADVRARFSLDFVKLGLLPDMGATHLLGRLLTEPRALEMALLGEPIDATTAQAWGLVKQVVPEEALLDTARALTDQLAARPPLALAAVKRAVSDLPRCSLDEALKKEMDELIRLMGTRDNEEAVRAWVEKRAPVFEGR